VVPFTNGFQKHLMTSTDFNYADERSAVLICLITFGPQDGFSPPFSPLNRGILNVILPEDNPLDLMVLTPANRRY
jgi:hypothetical protein